VNFFRENLPLKIASLALAIGVWAYVRGEDRPVQIFSVPLDLQNLPDNLLLAGGITETVNIRVRAPESVLRNLGAETFLAKVDLSGLAAGEQTVRVGNESVRVPAGVELVRVSPEFVSLRLENRVRSDLPVTARLVGAPAPGYVLGEAKVIPIKAMVEGPESALVDAVSVDTETIRVDGRSQPFEAMVDLYPARPDIKVVGDGRARVLVDIHERYVTRTITGVAVRANGAEMNVRLDPESVEVIIEGPRAEITALTAADVTATVDLAAVPSGQKRALLEPRIGFSREGLEGRLFVRGISPEAIAVRVLQGASR
jgi:YbbR domain-containing protein